MFLATCEAQKGEPLPAKNYFPPLENAGRLVVRAIGSSPEEPYSLIYATLLSAIANAETSVRLTNAYFAPDPQLLDALQAAAAGGISRVELIVRADNAAAIKLYERHGFELEGRLRDYMIVDGATYDALAMVLRK